MAYEMTFYIIICLNNLIKIEYLKKYLTSNKTIFNGNKRNGLFSMVIKEIKGSLAQFNKNFF